MKPLTYTKFHDFKPLSAEPRPKKELCPKNPFLHAQSPKLQRIPEEPTGKALNGATNISGVTLRNFRTELNTMLPQYSSFIQGEMLGRRDRTIPKEEEDKVVEKETVLPEYCDVSLASAWPEGMGIVRKGTKIGDRQGIVMMKSLQLSWGGLTKKTAKDFYVPFKILPALLHLKNRGMIRALVPFLSWTQAGELAFSPVLNGKTQGYGPKTNKRRYDGKAGRMFQIMHENSHTIHQLDLEFPRIEVYFPHSGATDIFFPSAVQIHRVVSNPEKRVETVCQMLPQLAAAVSPSSPQSFQKFIKQHHSVYGAVQSSSDNVWHCYRLSGFAVKIEGLDKLLKISLEQMRYLLVIARHEQVLKILRERIVAFIVKSEGGYKVRPTQIDLSRSPGYLKHRKHVVSGEDSGKDFLQSQERTGLVEVNGKSYAISLMLPRITIRQGDTEKTADLDSGTCQKLVNEGFTNWIQTIHRPTAESRQSPLVSRVLGLTRYLSDDQKLQELIPPSASSTPTVITSILEKAGFAVPAPEIVEALVRKYESLGAEKLKKTLFDVLSASLETTISGFAEQKAAGIPFPALANLPKDKALLCVRTLDGMLSDVAVFGKELGVNTTGNVSETLGKVCEKLALPMLEPKEVEKITEEIRGLDGDVRTVVWILLHIIRCSISKRILLSK